MAELAAFAAMGVSALVPAQLRLYPVVLSAVLVVLGLVLLLRQGLFRPAVGPGSRSVDREVTRRAGE